MSTAPEQWPGEEREAVAQPLVFVAHEIAEHLVTTAATIFAQHQGAAMFRGIIPSCQQPERIDCEFADDRGHHVDEERHVDGLVALIEEGAQPVRFNLQMRGKITE